MTVRIDRRTALIAAGSAFLLLALAFLFVRTMAAGYKEQLGALSLLRELRDGDMRWDADALRMANDLGATQSPVPDRRPIFARILHELQGSRAAAVEAQMAALRNGMGEKQATFDTLRSAHRASLAALDDTRVALEALATEAAALRGRDPRTAERVGALLTQVEQVRAATRSTDIEAQAEAARALEPLLATLEPAARSVDPKLAESAGKARAAVDAALAARGAEAASWRRFSFQTVGARAELASRTLSADIEAALDDKDRWRVYLFAYAIALLVVVVYLGMRVLAAQAALRQANDELEARVTARTRELEQTLAQLRESEAQLVQTEKMSSLGQLVAGVAHEINTPLAYVKNSVATLRERIPELHDALENADRLLEMLRHESPDPGELQSAFDRLASRLDQIGEHQVMQDLDALSKDGMHGIEQISELVSNLRSFSRLDRSRIGSFNVNDGVVSALLIARPALRKVDVEKHLGELPAITCSPSQVNQVFLNIITNAAQAIEGARGLIVVTTRREGEDHVAIEIRDNGKGIPTDALARIFDPFYTTKAPGQGTGLGLSIAYKIVAQHGGRIDVRSEIGGGTTFVIVLPVEAPSDGRDLPRAEETATQPA